MTSRTRILRAATKLFGTNGFHGTSTRRLAREAKVNEVTIYRVFGSKRELYFEVLEHNLALHLDHWLEPVEPAHASIAAARGQEGVVRLMLFAALEEPGVLRRALKPHLEPLQKGLELRHRAVERGLQPNSYLAFSLYQQFLRQLLDPRSSYSPGEALDVWLHGVLGQNRQNASAATPVALATARA